jgi:adenine-specific DNA-methyltransferase
MNKTVINKLNLNVGDGYQQKLLILKDLLPELFEDNKLSLTKFNEVFSSESNNNGRFNLMWPGKEDCFKTIQSGTTKTLKPEIDKSINWEKTENVFIEGNNLEVLQLLQKPYYNKIKLVYIDPPYNTGNDFVYNDSFEISRKEFIENTAEKYSSNPKTSGRFHSNWLDMMYPRLFLARNLMKQDGVIAVSIADEEIHHLRCLMDEIFGEENYRNTLLLRRYDKNLNNQFVDKGLKSVNIGAEYVVIYSKSDSFSFAPVYREASEIRQNTGYWKSFWNDANRPTMRYDILGYAPSEGQWKWKEETAIGAVENYKEFQLKHESDITLEEYWLKTGKSKKFIRKRENLTGKNQGVEHWIPPSDGILRSSNWTDILASESITNLGLTFSSPKNRNFLKELIRFSNVQSNEIVLDFFAGSGSTGHSVYEVNKEDDTDIKFILNQLDEEIEDIKFSNISEITRERLRTVLLNNNMDYGFRSFKLSESNFKIWNGDTENQELFSMLEKALFHIDVNSLEEDILTEILIKSGFELTVQIEEISLLNKKIYSVADGALLICLEKDLTMDLITQIAKLEPARVVCLDSGFKEKDDLKTNAIQIMKSHGIDDFRTV